MNFKMENIKVNFKIEFDAHHVVLNSFKTQLTSIPGFNWQSWNQAAAYCFQNSLNAEAEEFVTLYISMNENETNRNMYGYVLMNLKKNEEALKVFKKNTEKYPQSWNVFDSLGEALNKTDDSSGAIFNYKKALELALAN